MAVFRGLPWLKAVTYIFGQLIGAWLGALIVFANYSRAINIFEGGNGQRTLKSAGLFSTYPVSSSFPPFCPSLTLVNSFGLARIHVVSQLFFR
jgi:glycerol uptake facilitator-like aquaporin